MEEREAELQRFGECLDRVRGGCWDATADLFTRYFARSVQLARTKLDTGEARLIDAEMAVDSAFGSLIRRFQRGAYRHLDSETEFWQLLARVVQRKLSKYRRYYYAQRRDPGHAPISVERFEEDQGAAGGPMQLASEAHSPVAQAIADETLELLLHHLRDAGSRDVLLLRLEGFSELQIAEHLKRSRGWVQRRSQAIRRAAQLYLQEAC
jgi:DNA-directed RNA polymerase specialized sigma24 family protein